MTAALFIVGLFILAALALFAFGVHVLRVAQAGGRFWFRAGCQPLGITAEGEIDTRESEIDTR